VAVPATLLLAVPAAAPLAAQEAELDIRLHSGTPLEERGRQQLLEILATYPLERWLFTRTVVIRSRVIPHSHPVLTLNTQYVDDDVAQMATFLHEQMHWYITDHVSKEATDSAIEELQTLFPEAPGEPLEGARDRHSTYLHLIICCFELDALSEATGVETARRILRSWKHYTWVYSKVLADTDRIRDVIHKHMEPVAGSGVTRPNEGEFAAHARCWGGMGA